MFIKVQTCNNGDEENRKEKKVAKPCVKLPRDEEGFPILLTWEVIKHEGLAFKRPLVAKFLNEMYHE